MEAAICADPNLKGLILSLSSFAPDYYGYGD